MEESIKRRIKKYNEGKTAIAMVRKNKLNGQKTITVPKKIESIKEFDNIKFDEDEEGKLKIEKLNQ